MNKKGVETFNAVIYTTFFITFALFLLFTFLQVGVKEKGVVLGSLNSEHANRIANAINLIQTYDDGAIHIKLPGKYVVRLSSLKNTLNIMNYVEVAYKTEQNFANSKGFIINSKYELFPKSQIVGSLVDASVDFAGIVSTLDEPADSICIVKFNDKIYVFNGDGDTDYTLPLEVNTEKCSIDYPTTS